MSSPRDVVRNVSKKRCQRSARADHGRQCGGDGRSDRRRDAERERGRDRRRSAHARRLLRQLRRIQRARRDDRIGRVGPRHGRRAGGATGTPTVVVSGSGVYAHGRDLFGKITYVDSNLNAAGVNGETTAGTEFTFTQVGTDEPVITFADGGLPAWASGRNLYLTAHGGHRARRSWLSRASRPRLIRSPRTRPLRSSPRRRRTRRA